MWTRRRTRSTSEPRKEHGNGREHREKRLVERDIKKFTKGEVKVTVGEAEDPTWIYVKPSGSAAGAYLRLGEAENLAEVLAHAIRRSREVAAIEKAANDL